jgi:hypothetical protein
MIERRATGRQGYLRAVRVEAFVKGGRADVFQLIFPPRDSVVKLKRLRRDGTVVVVVVVLCVVERDKPHYRLPLVGINCLREAGATLPITRTQT